MFIYFYEFHLVPKKEDDVEGEDKVELVERKDKRLNATLLYGLEADSVNYSYDKEFYVGDFFNVFAKFSNESI